MKLLGNLFLLGFAALIVLAVFSSTFPATTRPTTASRQKTTTTATTATATPGSSVQGAPSISAQLIDSVLCAASSPACQTGADLYDLGVQYGIDPAYALAFFQHESGYGRAGVARETRGMGNIRCSTGYTCIAGFRAYATWRASYEDWYRLITWYVNDLGKKTLRQILYTYAPPADHNNTDGYINAVCAAVNAWRGKAAV